MQITLRQMQVFLAVARTENLSVAAQDLAMSKSAVSQALTELEGRLGVTLFERTRGRLLLSAEGRRLKPAADELMERTDDIESLFSGRTTGQLRLACTFTIGSFMLSDLMRDFQAHAGWMPEMRIANTAEVAESLLNFSTDISIVASAGFFERRARAPASSSTPRSAFTSPSTTSSRTSTASRRSSA